MRSNWIPALLLLALACDEPADAVGKLDASAALDAALDAPIERADAAARDASTSRDATAARDPERVSLALGPVRGRRTGDTVAFYGIRFGEPPVDALRFAPPQPAQPWNGELDATQLGPQCPQGAGRGVIPGGDAEQREDCLRLNIWAPAEARDAPVMVFIHGGRFTIGSGADMDGTRLSEASGAIIVGLNYRLGPLGFLAHPAFDLPDAPSGNLGLRDQQLALRWVRDHIAKFGGDPDNVTLFGESAGSQLTCYHLFAKGSEGLFQRAIMESGTCVDYPALPLLRDRVIAAGQSLIDALCPDQPAAECLRAQSASTIMAWTPDGLPPLGQDFSPQVDGVLLAEDPWRSLARGAFQRVPLIIGTQVDEWAAVKLYQGSGVPRPSNMLELALVTYGLYPDEFTDVLAHYVPPGASDDQANDLLGRLVSDSWFHCPARTLARGASDQGSDVHLYSFELGPSVHAQELDYVFGYPWLSGVITAPPFAVAAPLPPLAGLTHEMQARWSGFARAGSPNAPTLITWPPFRGVDEQHIVFDDTVKLGAHAYADDCDFWDGIHARRHARAN